MKCRINRGKTAGETGTVKWIGQLPDAPHDDFIGIELDAPSEFSYKQNTVRDKDCCSKIFFQAIFFSLTEYRHFCQFFAKILSVKVWCIMSCLLIRYVLSFFFQAFISILYESGR